ncbi:MAG: hypothetical protein ABI609_01825 [Acidobacteriota bacterium]
MPMLRSLRRNAVAVLGFTLVCGAAVRAQPSAPPEPAADSPAAEVAAEDSGFHFKLGFEAKVNYRYSGDSAVKVNFPLESSAPVFLRTVDPGSHFEFSTFTLVGDASWGQNLNAGARVDVGNLYDRNPTSSGKEVIVHDAWLRFGREIRPATLPEGFGGYLKVGKFGHFERQNDRHLESWGLLSTAFNRFPDVGLEGGLDLGRFVYVKASLTAGNPVFIRDPNALAGDNGTDALLRKPPLNTPTLNSGFVIPYDTEVQDLGQTGHLQTSIGVGARFGDEAGNLAVDVLAFARQRKLADTVALEGTFYGGDLDILNGPFNTAPFVGPYSLPLTSDKKEEVGANVWLYWGGFSFFGQYEDQKIAGLKRKGYEGEVAWRFDLPLVWGLAGRQLFSHIQPAIRYSKLEPKFLGGSPQYPAPSVRWDWTKIDGGLRLTIIEGIDLTAEYADNDFLLLNGKHVKNNESLVTLRWSM